jgi:hypothetical protein
MHLTPRLYSGQSLSRVVPLLTHQNWRWWTTTLRTSHFIPLFLMHHVLKCVFRRQSLSRVVSLSTHQQWRLGTTTLGIHVWLFSYNYWETGGFIFLVIIVFSLRSAIAVKDNFWHNTCKYIHIFQIVNWDKFSEMFFRTLFILFTCTCVDASILAICDNVPIEDPCSCHQQHVFLSVNYTAQVGKETYKYFFNQELLPVRQSMRW